MSELEEYTENDFELGAVKKFAKRASVFKSVGKILIGLIVVSGVAGLFGFSGWTRKTRSISSNAYVEFECILHAKRDTPLRVYFRNEKRDSFVRISVNADYLKRVSIKDILPKPEKTIIENNRLAFIFRTSPNASGYVDFKSYPSLPGSVRLEIGEEKDSVIIDQFVYP
jgi:hypothetical protein